MKIKPYLQIRGTDLERMLMELTNSTPESIEIAIATMQSDETAKDMGLNGMVLSGVQLDALMVLALVGIKVVQATGISEEGDYELLKELLQW